MSTKFDICSRALTKLGANTISSFSDDTREAEVASQLYEATKEGLLSEYYWNFATVDYDLSKDVATPADENWDYQFTIPGDCLEITTVLEQTTGVPVNYAQQGGKILSNETSLTLKYRTNTISEANFPPHFEEALVARLSAEFSESLNGEAAVIDRAWAEYDMKYRNARRADAQANKPSKLIRSANSGWVAAFRGNG